MRSPLKFRWSGRASLVARSLAGVGLCCGLVATHPAAHAFDLQGHRGARGLAPENTLTGFKTALDIGVTTLETDLALTRDHVLVLSHDPRLDLGTGARAGRFVAGNGRRPVHRARLR